VTLFLELFIEAVVTGQHQKACPMTIIPDPQPPYHEAPSSMLDTAAGLVKVIAALLGTILLIWIFVGIGGRLADSARLTDSVDPDAVPLVAMQTVGPAP
jgi:hypothetical protein